MRKLWRDAVLDRLQRLSVASQSAAVTRQQLLESELPRIVNETQSEGDTPDQTLSRELQLLRDEGVVEFLGGGKYRLVKPLIDIETFTGTDAELDVIIRDTRLRMGKVETGTELAVARRRIGQQRLRALALDNYGTKCALCDVQEAPFLIASHIVPWATSEDGRGDLTNVIILCRPHDCLFEFGYWSLDDELCVMQRKVPEPTWTIQALLPPTILFRKPQSHGPGPEYVKDHRTRFGFAT